MRNIILVFVLFSFTLLSAQDKIVRISDSKIQLIMSEESSKIFLDKIGDMADLSGRLNYTSENDGFLFDCTGEYSCSITIDLTSIDFRTVSSDEEHVRAYLDLSPGRDLYKNLFRNFKESGVSGTSMMKEKLLFSLSENDESKSAKLSCIRSTYVLERFDCALIIE